MDNDELAVFLPDLRVMPMTFMSGVQKRTLQLLWRAWE